MTNPMDHGRRSVLIRFRLNGAILFMRWDRGRRRLLHQVGQRRTRDTPFPTQTCPHTRAIFGRAILAQLPLPLDLFDRKLEPNDPADHLLEKFTRRVLDSPRPEPPRFESIGLAMEQSRDSLRIVEEAQSTRDVNGYVIPGRHDPRIRRLARVPVGRHVGMMSLEHGLAACLADRVMFALGAREERIAWGIETARAARKAAGQDPQGLRFGTYVNLVCYPDTAVARQLVSGGLTTFARFTG